MHLLIACRKLILQLLNLLMLGAKHVAKFLQLLSSGLRAGISTNFEATLSFFLLRLKNVSTSIIKGFCAAAESMDDTRMQFARLEIE
ncbi:MAG: hypothetical protein DMG92_18580 [Acidobacteria bacterium]|nr:MAG: hypothetical protein DMG92_18580 [Acidobacteriota bacterium]